MWKVSGSSKSEAGIWYGLTSLNFFTVLNNQGQNAIQLFCMIEQQQKQIHSTENESF
jgi:hypothetical protein